MNEINGEFVGSVSFQSVQPHCRNILDIQKTRGCHEFSDSCGQLVPNLWSKVFLSKLGGFTLLFELLCPVLYYDYTLLLFNVNIC